MDGPREHDQAVERLLRQSLDTPPRGGVTDACLDAETLAAWTEGNLSGAALEDVQLHVADCPRCQEIAGTLARLGSVVPHPEPAVSSRRWLAWFVPLATATAAVAIWFAVPGNVARAPTTRELDRFEQAPPSPPVEAPVSRDRAIPEAKTERRDSVTPRREPAAPAAAEPNVSEAEQSKVSEAAPPRQEAAAAADTATADSKEAAAGGIAKNRVEAARAPAAAPVPAPAAAPAAVAASRSAVLATVAPDVIASPDPSVRWRIIGSAVQHTSNGGSTWEAVSTGFPAELTAGAAPAATVCWLVGRSGVVLLTLDGQTWRRVPFPQAVDLSSVRTVDAGGRQATVSTTDGRTFVTTDAGATWAQR